MAVPRQPTGLVVCAAHEQIVQVQGELMAQVAQLEHMLERGFSAAGEAVQDAREAATSQVALVEGHLQGIERTNGQILEHVLALKREGSGPQTSVDARPRLPPLWLLAILFAGAIIVGMALGALLGPQRSANLVEDGVRGRVIPRSTPVVVP
jgi:hypothetical protein